MPCSVSQPPNHPVLPYTRISARPITTGETANGRSIAAFISALPGNRWRTSTIAVITPKTVLIGTATPTITMVSQKACCASGVVTASHAGPKPCSNVRKKTRPTGAASSRNR